LLSPCLSPWFVKSFVSMLSPVCLHVVSI
jgi:hypothetical protein